MANDTEQNAWPDVEHPPVATDEFTGFANSPVDEDGKRVDPREVDAYVDETDEGKARLASQSTESSIVAFKSEGTSTNGAPAAVVDGSARKVDEAGAADEREADEADSEPDSSAEGEGANEAP